MDKQEKEHSLTKQLRVLGAPGIATRSKDATGAPGLTTRSKRTLLVTKGIATNGADLPPPFVGFEKLVGARLRGQEGWPLAKTFQVTLGLWLVLPQKRTLCVFGVGCVQPAGDHLMFTQERVQLAIHRPSIGRSMFSC